MNGRREAFKTTPVTLSPATWQRFIMEVVTILTLHSRRQLPVQKRIVGTTKVLPRSFLNLYLSFLGYFLSKT